MIEHYGRLAAWVCDLDKPVGRSFGDVEHYRDRLAGVDGPVLEAAVGNGRLLVPRLDAGVRASRPWRSRPRATRPAPGG